MESQVDNFINEVTWIYMTLSQTSDLRPSAINNELFGELVRLCTQTLSTSTTKRILEDKRIQKLTPSLRQLCATAECYLETHWAVHISGAVETEDEIVVHQRLRQFPYYDNYMDLTRLELSAIHAVNTSPPKNIAFIGSGPLPLSSLCLCQALDKIHGGPGITTVLNIDHDSQAIVQSHTLAANLGSRAQGMQFLCQEAGSAELDLRRFDVVYLAALVGMTQEDKESVLVEVVRGMRVGSLLVVRTAHGLRGLLYPDFDVTTEVVLACLEICLIVHPYNHVVNSVIIGRVKQKPRSGARL